MKVKSKTFARTVLSFLRADVVSMTTLKINEKAANKEQRKGMEVCYTIKITGSKQMLNKLKEIL